MKSSITQIKHLDEFPTNRMGQVENRVSGVEDKVEKLDQSAKDEEKNTKKTGMGHIRPLGHHQKETPVNHGYRRKGRDTS
jgi:hypothetical protein